MAGDRLSPGAEAGPRDGLFLAGLALLILAGNAALLFTGSTYQELYGYTGYDYDVNFLGMSPYLAETWGQGRFPLWQPYWAGGTPMIGLFATAMLHPAAVLMALEPARAATAANTIVHLELTGLFSFLLLRRLSLSREAALCGALWAALSGYAIYASPIPGIFNGLAYFTFYLWTAASFIARPRLGWFALQAGSLTLLALSGSSYGLAAATYFGGLWTITYAVLARGIKWPGLAALVAAPVLALGLAAAQLLPAASYLVNSVKAEPFTWEVYRQSFLPVSELAALAAAVFSKRLPAAFFCLSAVVFAGLGLARGERSPGFKAAVTAAGVLAGAVVFGRGGAGRLLYHLPPLGGMLFHSQTGLVLQPLAAIVAAAGVDAYRERAGRGRWRWLVPALCLAAVLLSRNQAATVLLALIGLAGLARPSGRRAAALAAALAAAECYSGLWRANTEFPRFESAPEFEHAARLSGRDYRIQVMAPLLCAAADTHRDGLPFQPGGVRGERAFDSFITYPLKNYARLLAAIEPKCMQRGPAGNQTLNFSAPFKSGDFIRPENRALINLLSLRWLVVKDLALAESDEFELLFDPALNACYPDDHGRPALRLAVPAVRSRRDRERPGERLRFEAAFEGPSAGLSSDLAGVFSVRWSPAAAGRTRLLWQRALGPGEGPVRVEVPLPRTIPEDGPSRDYVLDFAAASAPGSAGTAVWTAPSLLRPFNTIVHRNGGRVRLLENREALPRARIVHEALAAADDRETAALMRNAWLYDPARLAVVHDPGNEFAAFSGAAGAAPGESAREVWYYHDGMEWEVGLRSDGLLAVSDNYFPGWRCWVDGREERVWRTDGSFRGARIAAGTHRVRLLFLPWCFRIGLFMSLSSGVFSVMLLIAREIATHIARAIMEESGSGSIGCDR